MLNKEKYASKIIEIAIEGSNIGMVNGKITPCDDIGCNECDWYVLDCKAMFKEWANSEYVERPKITPKEKQFLELAKTGWITRDYDSSLWWFSNKPIKNDDDNKCWVYDCGAFLRLSTLSIFGVNFEFITWSDKEPWSVEDLLRLEVEK